MTEQTELKPCPFCGGEAIWVDAHNIQCGNASCLQPHVCALDGNPDQFWNTRPAPAVAVKPLTFSDEGFAHNGLGTMYRITWHNDPEVGWLLYRHEGSIKTGLRAHEDREQLEKLATEDNERRILSALSPHPPLSPQEGLDEVKPVLYQAKESLRWSYDVRDYPADGNTDQDRAIAAIDAILAKLEKEEGK